MHYSKASKATLQVKAVSILLGFICFLPLATRADPFPHSSGPNAHVSFISGEVLYRSSSSEKMQKAIVGQELPRHSGIFTQAHAVAILTLPDHSQIKMNQNSEVWLDELATQTSSPVSNQTSLTLKSGSIFSKVQKQKEKFKFMIRTKTVVLGVRGTEFYTAFGTNQPSNKSLEPDVWMCVNEGEVSAQSLVDSKRVIVKKGEGIFVPSGKSVTPPKPYSWTKQLNWNMDPKQGEVVDKTSINSAYHDLLGQFYD